MASSVEPYTTDNMNNEAQHVSDSDSNSTLCSDVGEASALLESQSPKPPPSYVTFPETHQEEEEEKWKPGPGFWCVEVGR